MAPDFHLGSVERYRYRPVIEPMQQLVDEFAMRSVDEVQAARVHVFTNAFAAIRAAGKQNSRQIAVDAVQFEIRALAPLHWGNKAIGKRPQRTPRIILRFFLSWIIACVNALSGRFHADFTMGENLTRIRFNW